MLEKLFSNQPTKEHGFGIVGHWLVRQSDNVHARQQERREAEQLAAEQAAWANDVARVHTQHSYAERVQSAMREAEVQGLLVRYGASFDYTGSLRNCTVTELLQWHDALQRKESIPVYAPS